MAQNVTYILSLPYTIIAEGNYQLGDNLMYQPSSGAAITIQAANVDLDLGRHRLNGVSTTIQGGSTPTIGILIRDSAAVRVHNGRILGFGLGIELRPIAGRPREIELNDLVIDECGRGISGVGDDIRIHGNLIKDICPVIAISTQGISLKGKSINVYENVIRNLSIYNYSYPKETAFGIIMDSEPGYSSFGFIENNRIFINTIGGSAFGIVVKQASTANVLGNQIYIPSVGISYSGTGGMKYGNNIVTGAQYPYVGGTDIGNNH
jgi:hypothetical protein